jgi:hypothetical protein
MEQQQQKNPPRFGVSKEYNATNFNPYNRKRKKNKKFSF